MDHYPVLINFGSPEFKEVEKKLEDILLEVTSKLVGTTIFTNVEPMNSLASDNSIQATFTILYDDTHLYLRAIGRFNSWYKDTKQIQQPLFDMVDFELARQSYPSNDDISTALTYIFSNNVSIKKKYSKLLADAVAEYRNDRANDLKLATDLLLAGPRYEW